MWLRIFDFDQTLFRSPDVPQDQWEESLDPPNVPEIPGITWWVRDTLESLDESIHDPFIYVVVATGRQENLFKDRVYDLLDQVGMLEGIDEIHLTPKGLYAHEFKLKLFDQILAKMAGFLDGVEFWDDHADYLPDYVDLAGKYGLSAHTHLVSVPRKKPWYESVVNQYLGE